MRHYLTTFLSLFLGALFAQEDSLHIKVNPEYDMVSVESRDVLLALKVVDTVANTPLEATVFTTSLRKVRGGLTKGEGVCNEQGQFHFKLNESSIIEIMIAYPGYHNFIDTIDIAGENYQKSIYTKICSMQPFSKGEVVLLDNIRFKQGDDELLTSSYPTIDRLVDMMRINPDMVIKLNGHTENKGSQNILMELSQNRVNSVRFYLLQKGIKLHRIKSEGYGPLKPIYTGPDPVKQELNRRVEFEILKL